MIRTMNHRIKPASRLTIVFILAVVLSGSILTYFSINNISNQKELTEKRILEEQRELTARVSGALQNKIEQVTEGFKNEIDLPGLMKDSLNKTAAESDFIIQPFILDNNGQFLYPNFIGIPENLPRPNLSSRFIADFRTGEKAEFAEKDFGKAKMQYLSCLRYSTGSSDSVQALNALGRVSVKLNDFEDAIARYNLIIWNFSRETDRNGIPYIYYALPPLLKITKPNNWEKTLPVIEFCLEKMENGTVPLNYNTEELLQLVINWLHENTSVSPEKLAHINILTESIKQQIRFVVAYRNELSDLLKKGNLENHSTDGNDYKVVNSFSGNSQKFFLVNTNLKNPAGFLADRLKLFESIVKTDLQAGFEFEYKLEFPAGYSSNTSGNNLIYSSQLNPYFPEQTLQIKLSDENLINDFVKRRSWIYGISSVLLLVAMLLGVTLILRDIAREKHLARLRSDFISNVTHELKTPLTSIRMYAESLMLGRVKSASRQKEYLSVVVNESERLKRMINNILEFSKMEKAKQEYHPVESNLSEILLAAIRELNYWMEEKEFTLITEIDRNIVVKVDPEKFQQVFTNLLSNAIKYSGDSKKIYLRLFQNSGAVITEVEDEGIGISADNLTKIFEEFYRVEQQESGDISGTGLGLTVVKGIVEAHRGKIWVESKPGKGSKFSVILYQQ
jgi:signal transduction histidine kinase